MSDELPPPPLRLKPRPKVVEENATPAPAANPSAASDPASTAPNESGPPRLKLRPKLNLTDAPTEAPANTPTPPETVVSPSPAISLKPRLSIAQPTPQNDPTQNPPAQPPSSELTAASVVTPPPLEPPKFKLKEKAPTPVGDAPPAAATARKALPPPFLPVAVANSPAANVSDTPKSGTPPSVHGAPGTLPAQPTATPPPLLTKRPVQIETEEAESADPGQSSLAKIILLVAAVVLVGGVYFGYKKLTEPSGDEAEAPIAKQAPARPASPSQTLNEIGAIPAQAIKKAEDVVAAVKANEEAPVEEILANEIPVPPLPRRAAPKPAETSAAPVTATTELAPGLRATTVAAVEGDAAPAFRAWVAQVRISGVFQGTPARVLINGKTIPEGQVVDEALGIVFDGVDPETKTLVFRDATGATVARKF